MGLFDFLRRRARPTQTVGTEGIMHYAGYLTDGEKNADFTGRTRYKTTSNIMANCAIAGGSVRLYLALVGNVRWSAVPPVGGSRRANEIAEVVEQSWHDLATPWHRVIRSLTMYAWHGFAISEWTAKRRRDGVITFTDVERRPQSTIERWDLDEYGEVRGLVQRDPNSGAEIYLPRDKLLYAVDDSLSTSPEGLGLFRHILSAVKRRQRYENLEGLGYEMSLRGIPIARAPIAELKEAVRNDELTAAEFAQMLAPLKDLLQNHPRGPKLGLLLDSETYRTEDEAGGVSSVRKWGVELIQGDAQSVEKEIADALTRIDHEIARIANTEHLLLGQNRGTQALSASKTQMLTLVLNGIVNELVEVVDHDYVRTLGRLNGWDDQDLPKVQASQIQVQDVTALADVLETLGRAGAPLEPGDPAINAVREQVHLPPIDTEALDIDAGLRPTSITDDELAQLMGAE